MIFTFSLLIWVLSAQSQTYKAANWVFGDSVLLKFTSNTVCDTLINFSSSEATTSISGSNGNLLYYATPEAIYDSNSLVIKQLLGDNSSSQGIFIDILNNNKILAITTQAMHHKNNCSIRYLCFKLNDTNDVVNKLLLLDGTEQLGIINQQNNYNNWVLMHERIGIKYFGFLITDSNLLCCPRINYGVNYGVNDYRSFIIPSIDALKIVSSNVDRGIEIFNFNNENCSMNKVNIVNPGFTWSAVFSPDSKFLYYSSSANLYQYDILNNYIFQLNKDIDNNYRQLQNTIDGRILISMKDQKYLGVIEEPNKFGNDCKYLKDGLKLKYGSNIQGLPNFNQSYFYTPSIDFAYKEDCIHHNYSFEGRDTFAATSHTWRFIKGNMNYEVKGKNINHQFVDTGIWQVTYIAGNGQRSDTAVKNLTLLPKWPAQPLGADTFICPNQTLILRTPPNMHCIHWQGQEPNLDTANGPILDYDHFHQDTFEIDQKGVYTVKLTNKTFCQMWDSVEVKQAPAVAKPQISFATKELASTIKANVYRWFLNDTFLLETPNRSIVPTKNGFYQLQIISEFGCQSSKSDSFYVDLSGIDNFVNFSFEVFPNPTQGIITLQVPHKIDYTLFIYDVSGKLTRTQIIHHQQTDIDLSNLPKGLYTFKLKNEKDEVATKAVMLR